MLDKLKDKIIHFLLWIKKECKDQNTFILLAIVVVVMYSPVWGGYLLHTLFGWNWCLVVAALYAAFWAGPFTPFFPLCIAITLFLKRLIERISKYK